MEALQIMRETASGAPSSSAWRQPRLPPSLVIAFADGSRLVVPEAVLVGWQ